MPKFDYSEYQYSDYEKYLASRANTPGLILNHCKCDVHFYDNDRTVCLHIDPYFAKDYEYAQREEELNGNSTEPKPDEVTDENEDEDDDSSSEEKEIDKLCKRFDVAFYDEVDEGEPVPEHYNHEYYANNLSGSYVTYHLGEGLLDFFYFDIKKHISSLQSLFALMSISEKPSEEEKGANKPLSVKNAEQRGDYLYRRWELTNLWCKDFFFSSLYTTAFTPVFLEASEKTFRRYLNYIVSLQKEFREKIQFCFDPDFYPHVLGHLYPFERYQLYCSIYKEFPNEVSRTETFHVFRGTSNNEKMPFKDTGALLQERLAMKIDNDSDEYKEFVEKYAARESFNDILLRVPLAFSVSYSCNSIFDMLNLEFTKMLECNIKMRKCKRCGKFFIMKGNYDTNYCDRVEEGQTRSCQELAAQENYKAKIADNPALPIYSKYYKRYAARVRARQIKEADFKKWKFQALSKRDECSDGKITTDEYIEWLESCFPNRTKK